MFELFLYDTGRRAEPPLSNIINVFQKKHCGVYTFNAT